MGLCCIFSLALLREWELAQQCLFLSVQGTTPQVTRLCVCPTKKPLLWLFVCCVFPSVSCAAGVPLLQLFCDTEQPSNTGSPDQRAAVTDSLEQAGQVPNLLFLPESSAERLDRFLKHWRTPPGSFLPLLPLSLALPGARC